MVQRMGEIIRRMKGNRIIKTLKSVYILILKSMPDKLYLRVWYKQRTGRNINFGNPVTFNDKLQWLKLYDRKEQYIKMADKYEAKKFVSQLIGENYIIPTLGIYNRFEEIDFDALPRQFVLKCTHNSGNLCICRDKKLFDYERAKRELEQGLKNDYSWLGREWFYKKIQHRIIAEQYMEDESGFELKDYKIFNFTGGGYQLIQVDYGRFSEHKRRFYSASWEKLDMTIGDYPDDESVIIEKPKVLHELLELAKILSKGTKFLRTDFYIVRDKIYFGEMTFYPEAGQAKILPAEMDFKMGTWIELLEHC